MACDRHCISLSTCHRPDTRTDRDKDKMSDFVDKYVPGEYDYFSKPGQSDWEPIQSNLWFVTGSLKALIFCEDNEFLREILLYTDHHSKKAIQELCNLRQKYDIKELANEIEFYLEFILSVIWIDRRSWDRMIENGALRQELNSVVEKASKYGDLLYESSILLMVIIRSQAIQKADMLLTSGVSLPADKTAGTVETEPDDIITAKVAIADYHITKSTITKQLNKKLTDYRKPDHKQNDEVLLSRSEVERNYKKRR